ncbi:MAG: CCC motif membrane protein [Nonlabens sp.]
MQKLNTTAVYILSVVGVLCCCIGLGTVAAIIALVIAINQLKKYNENPELYSNGKAMKNAKIVAIISLVISVIGLISVIVFFSQFNDMCEFIEWYIDFAKQNPDVTEEQLQPMYDWAEQEGCNF